MYGTTPTPKNPDWLDWSIRDFQGYLIDKFLEGMILFYKKNHNVKGKLHKVTKGSIFEDGV